MKKRLMLSIMLCMPLLLSACGSSGSTLILPEKIENESHFETPALEIVEGYLGNVEGINGIQSASKENDPNGKLSESDGYISDTFFSYDQISPEGLTGDDLLEKGTDAGGSVEVYASKELAEERSKYLEKHGKLAGPNAVVGTVVFRFSTEMDEGQQQRLLERIIDTFSSVDPETIKEKKESEKAESLIDFFLMIDENQTSDEVIELAQNNGFIVDYTHHWLLNLYVSTEESTGRTNGTEYGLTYDTDYVDITFSKEDDTPIDKGLYIIGGGNVNYTFYNSKIEVNGTEGDWNSLEEAIDSIR